MAKNYYHILDKCLLFIQKRKKLVNFNKLISPDESELDQLRKYMEKDLELDFYEREAIIGQLQDDGLIYDGENCRLSLKGIQFIENGGYDNKIKKDKFREKNQKYINFALIFGGVPAGAYYTIEIVKMFF